MQQQISVVTLGIKNMTTSRQFYLEGFGWKPVFQSPEIIFYQMNGLVLGTWLKNALETDMQRRSLPNPAAIGLAHSAPGKQHVKPIVEQLVAAGRTLLRDPDAPLHGGFRGYVADPDCHPREVAWNPPWKVDAEGHVTFAV